MVFRAARTDRWSDQALLAAVAVGDADACTAFVRRFQRQVFGLAYTLARDPGAADDIAQRTFERVWRHAGSYDARRGSVRTWVLTICRRLAIDQSRLRRAEPTDPSPLLLMLQPSPDARPEELAEHSDEVSRVRVELAGLSEPIRRAVLLATLGGYTMSEIAVIEQVPLGTAKTRVRSGLLRLRSRMIEMQVTDDR